MPILTYFLPRLADSVQYDEETEKAYFAMPLTEKMTVDELFRKIGSFPSGTSRQCTQVTRASSSQEPSIMFRLQTTKTIPTCVTFNPRTATSGTGSRKRQRTTRQN
jgi:hypothetical protein